MIITTKAEYAAALDEMDAIWLSAQEMEKRARFVELTDAIARHEEARYPVPKPRLWSRFLFWLYRKGWLK